MKKFLGHSLIMASVALLAGCDGDSQLPKTQATAEFTEAPQTLTTKTAALPLQSDSNEVRSAVDAQADIAFVSTAGGTQVSALRLATRQHLWQLTLDGGVDQLFFDAEGKRLYISTGAALTVVDSMSGALLSSIEIHSPIVAITYLPARGDFARSHLVIGQRISANEWQISALEPNFLEVVASTTLPAVDDEPKLQITAGAGLIWTMNYQGQRLYTIRPYLLMQDAIYPIDNHQVVDSLRDTGLMISPDGEWLVTGGNNVLSSALDSDAQAYYEVSVHGFDHFSPTVHSGGVFWGDTFGLMVRDDLAPSADTGVRELDLERFSVNQVLSTVSGIFALGHNEELGLAVQWVSSNRAANSSNATPVSLSASQTFIPFDGVDSYEQGHLYLSAVFAAGNGLATVQPVCYEPCTFAKTLEIPLQDETQQAHIDIHQLTDGPISGVIVTASEGGPLGATWLFGTPAFCTENSSSEANQFAGDVDAGSLDLYMSSDSETCEDDERTFGVVRIDCPDGATDCEKRIELGQLSCGGSSLVIDGNYGTENTSLPISPIIYGQIGEEARQEGKNGSVNTIVAALDSSSDLAMETTMVIGSNSQENPVEGAVDEPNSLSGNIELFPSYPDELNSIPSKTTCF